MISLILTVARVLQAVRDGLIEGCRSWEGSNDPCPPASDSSHCCECEHPDKPCEHDIVLGFREDDLGLLFNAVEVGSLTAEVAMAEFLTGVRAEPDEEPS